MDLTSIRVSSMDHTPESDLVNRLANPVPFHQQVDLLREMLPMGESDTMQLTRSTQDPFGFTHFKYQQHHRGIQVQGGEYTVHVRDDQIISVSGEFFEIDTPELQFKISEDQALDRALEFVGVDRRAGLTTDLHFVDSAQPRTEWQATNAHQSELVYLADEDATATLTYKFDVFGDSPLSRSYVFVDVATGSIAEVHDRIHHADVPADGTSLYNGTVNFTADSFTGGYRLRQVTDGVQTFDLNNAINYSAASDVTSSTTSFSAADVRTGVQAHYGAEQTLKYFFDRHGRDSYDDAGSVLRSYVSYGTNYANAFWNGSVMTYGDGNSSWNPLVSLDIVGHEVSHGVTEYSAGLVYSYESGALNESFSDIFGEAIENFATGTNDWLMGEEIGVNAGSALRSLSDPPAKGDPDTYLGTYWHTSSTDNGGVHINSGVQNKWFYLLSAGESGVNDHGQAYDVTGIGIEAAEAIAYRNLTVYLTSGSQYFDAREGAIESAIDLFGENSQQHLSTIDAWDAVGVGGSFIEATLQSVDVRGSSVFHGKVSDQIPGPVVDTISLDLDPNQSVSIAVAGTGGLIPAIELRDPNQTLIANGVATDSELILQNVDVALPGTYQILVSGDAASTGAYDLNIFLNASMEGEMIDGLPNNSLANAQTIDGSTLSFGSDPTIDRLAVVGDLSFDGTALDADDFETGTLDGSWAVSSSETDGRIEIVNSFGANGSSQSLLMDMSVSGTYNLNEAIWTVDLSSVTDAGLSFYHAEWSDETDVLPASFAGSVNGDGVSISADGTNWTTVLTDTDQDPGQWDLVTIDLDEVAASAGISLGSNFQIKFQQYDNFAYNSDGRAYDEIKIIGNDPSVDWYAFDLDAGQSATLAAATVQGTGALQLELYDSGGNLIVAGTAAENVESAISQFQNPAGAATFHAVVSGPEGVSYNLVVTRGSDFDLEPNQTTAQNISGQGGVFGHVRSTTESTAEPDAFAAGTVIDTGFPGKVFSNNVDQGSIYSAQASFGAPTGERVFAPGATAANGFQEGNDELRVDFAVPVVTVSVDVGSDDASDVAWLRAYDSADNLLDEVISGSVSLGNFETISISRASADIAYVIAAGLGSDITPLDNLISGADEPNDDVFSIAAVANDRLSFQSYLPGLWPHLFHNPLETGSGSALRMELRDPDGNLVESGSETVSHVAALTGDYLLRVYADVENGEYFIAQTYEHAPSDVVLSADTIAENTDTTSGSVEIGTLLGTDIDSPALTFDLVPGSGDLDNDSFEIVGDSIHVRQAVELDFESQHQYSIRVEVSDGSLTFEKQLHINVTNQIEVDSIELGDGISDLSQRSMIRQLVVTFDEIVDIGGTAFSLIQRSNPGGATGTNVGFGVSTSDATGTTVATLTFNDTTRPGLSNALLDGNYELTIDANQITRDGTSTTMASDIVFGNDATDGFFALFGDANGDRIVDIADTVMFRTSLGSSLGDSKFNAAFDFDGNQEININDRVQFRSNRGESLPFV